MIKVILKKIIPRRLLLLYHKVLAYLAAFVYGYPSRKMIVIGVTGTSGKTTAVELISKVLERAGYKVGYTSTAKWKVADKEILNDKKMTMLGRFQTQRLLRDMVRAGCRYAIIETTSEGIEQFRASGIHYDIAIITNLYPEHLEAHGSFENYKKAKLKLFRKLDRAKHKIINGKEIKKVVIANFDDEHYQSFIQFHTGESYLFGIINRVEPTNSIEVRAKNISLLPQGVSFSVQGVQFKLDLLGEYNIYNALIAVCAGVSQGMSLFDIAGALELVKKIDGRLEKINKGQNFTVIVDYAFEPRALSKLYETVCKFNLVAPGKKIIHVLGSAGGGRDKARRPILGGLAAQNADVVIVTNEDPYDEDPMKIIKEVAEGAKRIKRIKARINSVFQILSRREAIKKALSLAGEGDLVLITGKGCEQAMVVKNEKLIPWDDRKVVKELLKTCG